MQHRLLHQNAGQRTFAVVLSSGDRVMENLLGFAKEQNIRAAQLTGIGAFSEVTLKYFDWETKKYQDIPVREQVEVASFIGDVAVAPSGEPTLHVHLVVGRRDGSAVAGHLGEGIVRPTDRVRPSALRPSCLALEMLDQAGLKNRREPQHINAQPL